MAETKMQLVDWFDDLCVRFIINLPEEELGSPERICFQIEEAQWFYEDFIRPLDPTLPPLNLRKFCDLIFQHCPLLTQFSDLSAASYTEFLAYKIRVPVRGAIMLNEAMTEVVLVKGWKKGAKWSFPRGKINKDEKDLDCAVREVYEETGYDIKAAGLIPNEEDVKSLDQTMREQHMRLFVFRGIPMDTYFEPRTRKEISKISWYKLADLPTLKKEKHTQQQGIVGEDMLKGSHFYMVAPFIRALKVWIKQQRRLDRMEGKAVPTRHVILEEDEAEDTPVVDEQTADEALLETTDAEDAGHMERLLFNLRSSEKDSSDPMDLPELSAVAPPSINMAAELKRILSVGNAPAASVPKENEVNPLLAILRGNQPPAAYVDPRRPLQMPAAQSFTTFPQVSTYGHHMRPPPTSTLPPTPQFSYSSEHGGQADRFHPQGPRPFPIQQSSVANGFSDGGAIQIPFRPQFSGPPPYGPAFIGQIPQTNPIPSQQQQQAPKPWERSAQVAPQFPQYNPRSSIIPPASHLPAPKLTSHALNLLNVFKSPAPQTARPAETQAAKPTPTAHYGVNVNSSSQDPSVPPKPLHARGPPAVVQPQATKLRSAQQDNLLNLFRTIPTPTSPVDLRKPPSPQLVPEPVELSAQPSPHVIRDREIQQQQQKLSMRRVATLTTESQHSQSPVHLTSATISGPLNAPDFESVRRRQQPAPAELANGDTTSAPAHERPLAHFHPTAILARAPIKQAYSVVAPLQRRSPPALPLHTVTNKTPLAAPQAFHPTTILRRPNREIADMMASPSQVPIPASGAQMPQRFSGFNGRSKIATQKNEQKQTLLNLFGGVGKMGPPSQSSSAKSTGGQPNVSRFSSSISGLDPCASPISSQAAPANSVTSNLNHSLPISLPTDSSNLEASSLRSSRINSVASETGTVIHRHQLKGKNLRDGGENGLTGTGQSTPVTPIDKSFLLGFLENVANSEGVPHGAPKKRRVV